MSAFRHIDFADSAPQMSLLASQGAQLAGFSSKETKVGRSFTVFLVHDESSGIVKRS